MRIGRLSGVIFLVTVFEELSHVTSTFWLRHIVNPEIPLFYKQNLRSADSHVELFNWRPDSKLVSKKSPKTVFLDFFRSLKAGQTAPFYVFFFFNQLPEALFNCDKINH